MSQVVTYAFFGEDKAQHNFLEKYLHHQYPNTFIEDEDNHWQFKASNGDQVDALLPDALRKRVELGIDVLFVGRDLDTAQDSTINTLRNRYKNICIDHPAVLILPIQCIEYWLWYIKRRQEEPGKNTTLESQLRSTAKKAVYSDTKLVINQIKIANQLLTYLDVPWLESRSESFRHFHEQVENFLDKLP